MHDIYPEMNQKKIKEQIHRLEYLSSITNIRININIIIGIKPKSKKKYEIFVYGKSICRTFINKKFKYVKNAAEKFLLEYIDRENGERKKIDC